MDKKFNKLVANLAQFGVPMLVLLVVMSFSGLAGAAAITSSLALLGGPFGMLGGIGALLLLGQATKFGTEKTLAAVFSALIEQGYSRQDIINQIESYPIPKALKARVIAAIKKI